jgi:early secretory antigenic target protein ESAT-6
MPSDEIFAQYGEIETAVLKMKAMSQVIDGKLDVLRKELTEVPWTGSAHSAWMLRQQQWDEAVLELNSLLQLIAQKVGRARENYITTENEVSRQWRNAPLT